MFEERLRIVLIVLVTCWLIVVLRLFQLQVVQADYYQQRAQQRLVKSSKPLEPIRGRILDRLGGVLASDEPAWAISLHYRILTSDPDYHQQLATELTGNADFLQRHARRILRARPISNPDHRLVDDLAGDLERGIDGAWVKDEIEGLWQFLAQLFGGETVDDLSRRADEITRVFARWKADHVKRHHLSEAQARKPQIREENQCHAIIAGLNHQQRLYAQRLLRQRYGWLVDLGAVEITDSSRRVYHHAECLAHVVGRLRQVTPADIDPDVRRLRDTPESGVHRDGGYTERDLIGESGVERMCEQRLRGERGSLTIYRDDRPPRRIDAVMGRDVELTVDYDLQLEVYRLLGDSVAELPEVPGGSVVVLDIPTRQVLALVSYPAFDPNQYRRRYPELSRDVRSFPLHFRAVYRQYEPGSIMKPLTVLAAHSAGLINEQTIHECRGRLFPDSPAARFRCWIPARGNQPIHHGLINSEQAIKGSCNVFCFWLGDLFRQSGGSRAMGVQQMCEWMVIFGIGRSTGIGLREEKRGIRPTPSYLQSIKGRAVHISDARNYSIGQGEIQVTPIQAANLVAIYASGVYRPVSLLKDQNRRPVKLPIEDSVWRIIRRGMYQVVNESGGTARLSARLDHPQYALCGKSGSAQTSRWITQYRVDYQDGDQQKSVIIQANNASFARSEFTRLYPELKQRIVDLTPAGYWPTHAADGREHSHAWFVAFIQPKGPSGLPDWNAQPRVAIAVLLEFGGSGGRTSGPLCRDVAELIINQFPQYVDPQAPLTWGFNETPNL